MLTKKRLEELIEQKATIYELDINLTIFALDLTNYQNVKIKKIEEYGLNRLYETLEEAEWVREFGNVTRTERLKLPTWEEIFPNKNIVYNGIYDCWWQNCCRYGIEIVAYITDGDYENGSIRVNGTYFKGITKENYIKACRIAKSLFLGEP